MVYTVCACTNSGGIPPAPVTIPCTIVDLLDSELFIQVGITASPSAAFDNNTILHKKKYLSAMPLHVYNMYNSD